MRPGLSPSCTGDALPGRQSDKHHRTRLPSKNLEGSGFLGGPPQSPYPALGNLPGGVGEGAQRG